MLYGDKGQSDFPLQDGHPMFKNFRYLYPCRIRWSIFQVGRFESKSLVGVGVGVGEGGT